MGQLVVMCRCANAYDGTTAMLLLSLDVRACLSVVKFEVLITVHWIVTGFDTAATGALMRYLGPAGGRSGGGTLERYGLLSTFPTFFLCWTTSGKRALQAALHSVWNWVSIDVMIHNYIESNRNEVYPRSLFLQASSSCTSSISTFLGPVAFC